MNRIAQIFCFLLLVNFLNAQTINDALRYSFLELGGGTARTIGLGGSMGAIGADYATLSTNPAGLAMYRSSEFVITPAFQVNRTQSILAGPNNASNSENANDFSLSNIGVVLASQPIASKWKSMNFGIGMNKLANFSQEFTYSGTTKGSIVDRWLEFADGFSPDELYPYEEGLAYETGAIFPIEEGSVFYSSDFEGVPNADVKRSQTVRTDGKYNEMVLSLGGNYNNKFMYGLTVGLPFIQYSEQKVYTEENNDEESIPFFRELVFEENLLTTGFGINAKFGVIYRINQMFRLGASIHTPSAISLTDRWDTALRYDYAFFDDEGEPVRSNLREEEPAGEPYEYKLRTPMRAMISGAAIIKRSGFITAEVEFVDYSNSNFSLGEFDRDYQETLNQEINDAFTSAINFRLGGEYVYEKFQFRAGYGIIGTPYANGDTNTTYSLGVGFRQKKFFLDFAYKGLKRDDTYIPYRLASASAEQIVSNEGSANRYILTLGFRF